MGGGGGGVEGEVGEGGVVVEESGDEGGDEGAKEAVDDDGGGESKGVGGESFALVEAVGLVVEVERMADLDVGGGGEVVIREEVEGESAVEGVGGFLSDEGEDEVGGLPRGGGVGVFEVEGGGGEMRGTEVVVELVAARSRARAGAEEAELAEA